MEVVESKRRLILVGFLFSLLIIGVDAWDNSGQSAKHLNATQDVLLDAVSWKAFSYRCAKGDKLSGEFLLIRDGDLFMGDQTKYDNWLLGGIGFLILDEENYNLWAHGNPATSLFERETVVQLAWSVEIPKNGLWYVIYLNDSIYMKQIEGSIHHYAKNDPVAFLALVGLVGLAATIAVSLIYKRKNG
ncbi:MAG: hypothetical protein EAX87_01900 [Candidatus Thorarchaeota archaeon]|nr:hypothetical protein [Candidatus Thorarchaeota archaeon]